MQYTSKKRFSQKKIFVKSAFISGFSELDKLGAIGEALASTSGLGVDLEDSEPSTFWDM